MSFNHNPHNLKVGQIVILDRRHEVTIVSFTPLYMFAKVKDKTGKWNTMTLRLSPKTESKRKK